MRPIRAGVLDYGMGNLRSVEKALAQAGAKAFVSADAKVLERADLLVVPGVGAFESAMGVLRKKKLHGFVKEWIQSDRPYFGICLGLQILFEKSEEAPGVRGLGVLPGKVVKFRLKSSHLKVPHMGWNEVHPKGSATGLGKGVLPDSAHFYFVHSFYPRPADRSLVWATTPYGGEFCSAVARGNLAATQFHPEKSGPRGLRFLKNLLSRISSTR